MLSSSATGVVSMFSSSATGVVSMFSYWIAGVGSVFSSLSFVDLSAGLVCCLDRTEFK